MPVIYKYEFPISGIVKINMPTDALVLKIECQNGTPCLWAIVNPERPVKTYRFVLLGTGFEVPSECQHLRHIATFQQSSFVWHVFGDVKGWN